MLATFNIEGLAAAEQTAKEILEHVEAIKNLLWKMPSYKIDISVDLKSVETASGN